MPVVDLGRGCSGVLDRTRGGAVARGAGRKLPHGPQQGTLSWKPPQVVASGLYHTASNEACNGVLG